MSSKVPGSVGFTTSCSLRASRRLLETDVMLGFLRAMRSCSSSSEGIFDTLGWGVAGNQTSEGSLPYSCIPGYAVYWDMQD